MGGPSFDSTSTGLTRDRYLIRLHVASSLIADTGTTQQGNHRYHPHCVFNEDAFQSESLKSGLSHHPYKISD